MNRLVRSILTLSAAVLLLGALGTSSADAASLSLTARGPVQGISPHAVVNIPLGSNGQQLVFIDSLQFIYYISLWGTKQNGTPTHINVQTPHETTYVLGYYWVGTIRIDEYDINGYYRATQDAYGIPRSQPQPYWCFDDGGALPPGGEPCD